MYKIDPKFITKSGSLNYERAVAAGHAARTQALHCGINAIVKAVLRFKLKMTDTFSMSRQSFKPDLLNTRFR